MHLETRDGVHCLPITSIAECVNSRLPYLSVDVYGNLRGDIADKGYTSHLWFNECGELG